jgi:hypothetical protein
LLSTHQGNVVKKKGCGGSDNHKEGKKVGQESAPIGFELGEDHMAFINLLVKSKAADKDKVN